MSESKENLGSNTTEPKRSAKSPVTDNRQKENQKIIMKNLSTKVRVKINF